MCDKITFVVYIYFKRSFFTGWRIYMGVYLFRVGLGVGPVTYTVAHIQLAHK